MIEEFSIPNSEGANQLTKILKGYDEAKIVLESTGNLWVGKVARLQIGVRIPVFVLTRKGIEFVANYSSKELREYIEEGKRYVIMGHSRNGALNCRRIRMGNFETHLGEIDELPLKVDDEPRPLI